MSSTSRDKATFKNILLTSCGIYPQVITEIVYALSQQNPPVFLSEIHVITTQVGLEQIKRYILDEKEGFFFKLCEEYGLHGTRFESRNIKLLRNAMGIALEDIQSLEENEVVANAITESVRKLTSRADTALHVSLAGGRRTISYYLGYALSLFGRPQDRLSHTLVSRAYEADDEFFYPNKEPTFITDRKGNTLNTQHAKVHLVEIPFVRLRDGLPLDLIKGKTSFVEAVASVPKILKTAQAQIHLSQSKLILNDTPLKLPPILFAWYAWFALRLNRLGKENAPIAVRAKHHEEFLRFLETLYGVDHQAVVRANRALLHGFDIDYISEKNSLINRKIAQSVARNADGFKILSIGRRPNTRYLLALEPENVLVKEDFGEDSQLFLQP